MLEPEAMRRYQRQLFAMIEAIDDAEALAQVHAELTRARTLLVCKVERMREVDRYSWAELARALGVTRSAAAQRFGRGR